MKSASPRQKLGADGVFIQSDIPIHVPPIIAVMTIEKTNTTLIMVIVVEDIDVCSVANILQLFIKLVNTIIYEITRFFSILIAILILMTILINNVFF
jgi:hypothetical protein